ncbi:hypothetical protein BC832DRAFT_219327 [Gaertneriomyces semiglobifer]|nr:hypothetical protein BC832DRAFT_219327 [Gaertneriomyces semiglobifer]
MAYGLPHLRTRLRCFPCHSTVETSVGSRTCPVCHAEPHNAETAEHIVPSSMAYGLPHLRTRLRCFPCHSTVPGIVHVKS